MEDACAEDGAAWGRIATDLAFVTDNAAPEHLCIQPQAMYIEDLEEMLTIPCAGSDRSAVAPVLATIMETYPQPTFNSPSCSFQLLLLSLVSSLLSLSIHARGGSESRLQQAG